MSGLGGHRSALTKKKQRIVGKVVDNLDPKKMRRVKVEIPEYYGAASVEALPWCLPREVSRIGNTSICGTFGVPIIGSLVYIEFLDDDPMFPEWEGGPITPETKKGDIEDENYPHRYGHRDEKGNYVYVDRQTDDVELLHKSGTKIHVTPTGSVIIEIVENEDVHIVGNLTATVDGNVTATVGGDVTADVTGNVTAEVGGNFSCTASGTGNLEAGGALTLKGSSVTVIGSTITHQGVVSGNSTATYSGEVTGNGKKLSTHTHGGVRSGGDTSGPPS